MAVLRFFFGSQFGKGLSDLRETKKGIVSKAVRALGSVEDDAFCGAAKGADGLAVARGGEDTHEASGALVWGNAGEFAKDASIVGFVVGVGLGQVRLIGGITRRVDARRSAKRIISSPESSASTSSPGTARLYVSSFLSRVRLERGAVFDYRRQGEKFGMLAIVIPTAEAAPAKSRSLPALEVAISTGCVVMRRGSRVD